MPPRSREGRTRRACNTRTAVVPYEPPAWATARLTDLMTMRTKEGFRPPRWSKEVDQIVMAVIFEDLPSS